MSRSDDRPLLLVDVDGVISLFGFPPDARPDGTFVTVEGIPHLLSASAGEHLRALAEVFEMTWCTGWEERANEHLPHLLGLGSRYTYLSFDATPSGTNAHWKLAAIDRHAGRDRPVAWIDDALDERCDAWAAARPGPTLLVRTEPATGLTDRELRTLLGWAASLPRP